MQALIKSLGYSVESGKSSNGFTWKITSKDPNMKDGLERKKAEGRKLTICVREMRAQIKLLPKEKQWNRPIFRK